MGNIDRMCFSEEVSFATLIIGLLGSSLVYTLGSASDHIIAFFIGYVSLMQGVEWILWKHQTCDSFHKKISVLGMLLNTAQPLILGVLVLLISPRSSYYKSSLISVMILYSLYSIFFVSQYKDTLQCTNPRSDDPHLVWNWTIMPYYYVSWFIYIFTVIIISLLGMPTLKAGILFAVTVTASMITSIFLYPRQDMGAMWCFFSVFAPPLYYIYRISILSNFIGD